LEGKKQSLDQQASQLRDQLKMLWMRLDISEDSMKAFLAANEGHKLRCIEAVSAAVFRVPFQCCWHTGLQ